MTQYRIALQYISPNCYYVVTYLPIPWQSQIYSYKTWKKDQNNIWKKIEKN